MPSLFLPKVSRAPGQSEVRRIKGVNQEDEALRKEHLLLGVKKGVMEVKVSR